MRYIETIKNYRCDDCQKVQQVVHIYQAQGDLHYMCEECRFERLDETIIDRIIMSISAEIGLLQNKNI